MADVTYEPRDEVLVVAAMLGDLDAFGELVSRYRAAVVRTAQAIVGQEDAEDVAQESLLLAFKALPSLEEPTKFPAWLAAITRHRAIRFNKQLRFRSTARVELDELLLENVKALSPSAITDGGESHEVRAAMDRIPGEYGLVLKLRFQDEMPLKRIAAYLGLPLSTVKWRLHRGKRLLRQQIESSKKE